MASVPRTPDLVGRSPGVPGTAAAVLLELPSAELANTCQSLLL